MGGEGMLRAVLCVEGEKGDVRGNEEEEEEEEVKVKVNVAVQTRNSWRQATASEKLRKARPCESM